MLLQSSAQFELAVRLRNGGVSISEAFSFMSPLYFRGKLAYATTFANAPMGIPGAMVITPCRGLADPAMIVGMSDLEEIASEQVALDNPKYRDPLERDLDRLSEAIGPHARVILLGSIATDKYIPLLAGKLGERLVVPRQFVGLGNMSRGALLLRCSCEKCELEYTSAAQLL